MMSLALQNPKTAGLGIVALAAVALGAVESRAQAPEAQSVEAVEAVETNPGESARLAVDRLAKPYAQRFPNMVLKSHDGRLVRFYDDLLEGKVVLINFMYATCTGR